MLFSNTGYHNAASKILEQVGCSTFNIKISLFKKQENIMFAVKSVEIDPKFNLKILHPWFPKSELWNTACHLPARPVCLPLASMEKCHAQQCCPAPSTQRCSFGTFALGSCSDPQTLPALPCGGSLPASMLTNCFPSNSLSCAEPVTTNHRTNWLTAQAHLGQ